MIARYQNPKTPKPHNCNLEVMLIIAYCIKLIGENIQNGRRLLQRENVYDPARYHLTGHLTTILE